jgi:hypothetical protein
MKSHIDAAIELLKKQDINGCITGSCLLEYFENQDIDVFVYDESSFTKLLFFMYYNDMFTILDPLEKHKFEEYTNNKSSSLNKIGLISIKFKYNLLVDINVVYKKNNNNVFDVIANFDLDIIAQGYDIKSKKFLSLRETTGKDCNWNTWNPYFYDLNFWNVKRILRQFERVIKYTHRGYNVTRVTDKYIEITEHILKTQNIYTSERGVEFFNEMMGQFQIVLKIIKAWKETQSITPEEILILKTLI